MLFSKKTRIVLDPALYAQALDRAQRLGMPLEAYIARLIERDLKDAEEQKRQETVQELKDQMKGLGYLQ